MNVLKAPASVSLRELQTHSWFPNPHQPNWELLAIIPALSSLHLNSWPSCFCTFCKHAPWWLKRFTGKPHGSQSRVEKQRLMIRKIRYSSLVWPPWRESNKAAATTVQCCNLPDCSPTFNSGNCLKTTRKFSQRNTSARSAHAVSAQNRVAADVAEINLNVNCRWAAETQVLFAPFYKAWCLKWGPELLWLTLHQRFWLKHCTFFIIKKKERKSTAYQMAVFAHRVSAAQAVCAVVHVLLTPRPGKAWAAQAVKTVHRWNTTDTWEELRHPFVP